MKLRKLCAQCHSWVERTAEWYARQPGGVVFCSGKCRSMHALEQRELDAHERRAQTILAADTHKEE